MGLVTDYLKYQEEFQNKYGERTVVLYQNGSFYEIFEYDPDKNETSDVAAWPTQKLGHAVYLSSLLGYTLTKRNKAEPYSLKNPNMVGFPIVAYDKYKDLILSKDFTIVVVDQERAGKNAPRKVTQVVSPATEIDELNPIPVSNQIISIYIDVQKEAPKLEEFLIVVGVSSIDVTTGSNQVSEIYSKKSDQIYAIQEVYRFLLSSQPREVILNIIGTKSEKYKTYIESSLEINNYPICSSNLNKVDKEYLKPNYHQKFLNKLFSSNLETNSLIVEELGLERMLHGIISYIILLQYCYEHNERLIEKLEKPNTEWIDQSKHLIIAHNALKQLDIVNTNKNNLIKLLDQTSTSLGKRFLHQNLTNPLTDSSVLNERYEMIAFLVDNPELIKQLEELLKKIPDLDRYQRKLQLGLIKPNEFSTLFKAYISIVSLYRLILQGETPLNKLLFKQVSSFNSCLSEVLSLYNLDNLANSIIEGDRLISPEPIFYAGKDLTSDKYIKLIRESSSKLDSIVNYLNSKLNGTRGKLIEFSCKGKTKKTDPAQNMAFFTTLHKGKILSQQELDPDICGNLVFTNVGKESMITSEVIGSTIMKLLETQSQYNQYLYRKYCRMVNEVGTKYMFFSEVSQFVSRTDYIKSCGKTALKFKYFRPTIISDSDRSHLNMKELRHPLSERLIDQEYITNDVELGKTPLGMLLYGANSVGKSTFTKAVGLNIIMAQAGMFIPSKLVFTPYNKIITRLSGEDNLIQGKSSFVVAMTELRTICRNADQNTLVLGDELCRETESLSGSAIAIQTLRVLTERKSTFIFSTHMHNLPSNKYILELPTDSLRVCHLSLHYDGSVLVFDRKLKDGPGDSIYGLEVAKSLSFDPEFIEGASRIRKHILGSNPQLLSTAKSRYNSSIYVHSCSLCGKEYNLESHHVNEQSKADKDGFIDNFHKNASFNIITICDNCHKNIHSNGIRIITQQTPKGKIIKFSS